MEKVNRTRTERLTLRLSVNEKEYILNKKERANYSTISDFILNAVSDKRLNVIDTKPILELAAEINKIGVNINQIAKIANTTENIAPESITRIRNEIDIISFKIDNMLRTYSIKSRI